MKTKNDLPSRIFSSCVEKETTAGEKFVEQHVFDFIVNGTSQAYLNDKILSHKSGDLRYVKRNTICKFYKQPPVDGTYDSITICLNQNLLMDLYEDYGKPELDKRIRIENIVLLNNSALFRNYLDSLTPYINQDHSKQVVEIKAKEAVVILLESNTFLKNVLFDFNEPGKIDLENFMNRHYKMDSTIDEFAYLSGRSLSTFKRDFTELFQTSPNKWLLSKRLEEARYLITQKHISPTNAYFEVGFKDYSHFSVAFKKHFGYTPSNSVIGK